MLDERNGNDGYYGTPNQFALLERDRLNTKAIKIMNELNDGWLWTDEYAIRDKIYDYLLDGIPVTKIKQKMRSGE